MNATQQQYHDPYILPKISHWLVLHFYLKTDKSMQKTQIFHKQQLYKMTKILEDNLALTIGGKSCIKVSLSIYNRSYHLI